MTVRAGVVMLALLAVFTAGLYVGLDYAAVPMTQHAGHDAGEGHA